MGLEPHVDAVNMKTVVAFGQYPTRFSLLELGQAYWAFQGLGVGLEGVDEDRERQKQRRIEAPRRGHGRRGGIDVEDELGATMVAMAAELAAASAQKEPASIEVEANH